MENKIKTAEIDISIVVPLYNEEESLGELAEAIDKAIFAQYSYEIIFVDDGSTDTSFEVIRKLSAKNELINGISFAHNYGKSVALQAGFEQVRGKYVITMDADLQDDPDEVPEMIQMLKDGLDMVSGWKKERFDPISKTVPSKFFNFVTRKAAGIELHDFNCGLKAYKREVVDNIYLYGELHRYIPMLAKKEGFTRIGEKVVKHHPRKYGETKFGLSRFINGFLDLITILFVQRYFQKPMHFFGTLGIFLLIAGTGINAYMAVLRLFFDKGIGDRPLLFLGILLMVLGIQLLSTGLIGELININHVKKQKPKIREVV
ncbi:MAG: glycosyltransferase family 2 protein [Balneola sp.]